MISVSWSNIVGQSNESMPALLVMFFTRSDADEVKELPRGFTSPVALSLALPYFHFHFYLSITPTIAHICGSCVTTWS
jgi:hypothetical protein